MMHSTCDFPGSAHQDLSIHPLRSEVAYLCQVAGLSVSLQHVLRATYLGIRRERCSKRLNPQPASGVETCSFVLLLQLVQTVTDEANTVCKGVMIRQQSLHCRLHAEIVATANSV